MQHITTAGMARIEGALTGLARREARLWRDGQEVWARALRHERNGMQDLAKKLGILCDCVTTPKSKAGPEKCLCAGTKKRLYTRLNRLPGRGTITLAGKGCRDPQGKFVPVAQCNPAQYAGRWIMLPE